jgi:zinc protease
MVESLSRSRNDNGYWIGQLQDAQEKPASLDEIRHHVADLESVTPADIQRMAQTYLRPDHAWRAEVVSANAPAQ